MKSADGKVVTKTMLTLQMAKMIEEGTLRPSAQISRNSKDGFRALATYKEFQSVALGRTSRSAMDRQKTTENKKLYDQIVKKEMQRDAKPEDEVTSASYWTQIAITSAIGLAVAVAVLWGFWFLFKSVMSLFNPGN